MREESAFDKTVKEYEIKVSEFYPGFRFSERRSIFSGDEPTSCHYEFSLNANNLKGTEYHINRLTNLIHYTSSIQNVVEIFNSGVLRLSSLGTLNDPQELNYVTHNLNMKFTPNQIEDYKSSFFSASFCKIANHNKPDDFPMWRLYGNDGYGAAIVFEIVNYRKEWSKFLLAEVQYGDSLAVNRFKDFIDFHNDFQNSYNNPSRICLTLFAH